MQLYTSAPVSLKKEHNIDDESDKGEKGKNLKKENLGIYQICGD